MLALFTADDFRQRIDPNCQTCNGTGGDAIPCPECGGTGAGKLARDYLRKNAHRAPFARLIQAQTQRRAQRWPGQ